MPFVRLDNDDPELLEAVKLVASRSAFTLGEEVDAFEREFADWCGAASCIGVSSGTEALALALKGLDIGPGDEVIVPANSFIATAEAVTLAGARARPVDVDQVTGLLTAPLVERAIGPSTRCVIPVHLYGATVDMEPIMRLARSAGVLVVEDACQAHGAQLDGRRAGTIGHCGCFSFYPTKNLGGWGDGGAVVTSDPALDERIRLLRSHGEPPGRRHHHLVPGTTARLDAIQAAVLRVKLRRLEESNHARRRTAAALNDALADAPLSLPSAPEGGDHVYHLYVVRCADRDGLRKRLAAEDIASAVHYPTPIHLTAAYSASSLSLPAVERRAHEICSLPMWSSMTAAELERVVDVVRRVAHGP